MTAAAFLLNRELEKRKYKLSYSEVIIASAGEFGLDRYLVAAVIHCESGNDPSAVSPRGATGLMQIMPDTGAWIAEKMGMEYGEGTLYDPAINVRMGCWYLRYLLDKFDGSRTEALAAYNAGPGNVSKWLEDERYSANGELTSIPFPETETYVARVRRAYDKYMELYEEELG